MLPDNIKVHPINNTLMVDITHKATNSEIMLMNISILVFLPVALVSGQQVTTAEGPVRGVAKQTLTGKTFYTYFSIPFGKAPIGNQRFLASEPADSWTEVYDATTEKSNVCYQMNSNSSIETEDCLYLSVFTPQDPSNSSKNYPVLVNIHGGGFYGGSGKLNGGPPPNYLIDEDILVVYLNYRLGVFGFLATDDGVIPGNAGLSDQILALKWVQRNIAAFGGNPEKVTISGQSAGSKSVGYLVLSTQAKGLFSAGIMESGAPLCVGGFQRNHTQIAFRVGSFIDPQFEISNDTKKLLEVLQGVEARALNAAASHYSQWASAQPNFLERNPVLQGYYFAPVIDSNSQNPIVPEKMYEQLINGSFNRVPVFMGVCSEEGLLDRTFQDENYLRAYDTTPSLLNPQGMNVANEEKRAEVGRFIKKQYSPSSDYIQNPLAVLQYYTDQEYVRGSTKHAELQARFTDVFYYQFSFTGDLDGGNTGYPGSGNVSHVSEGIYIYGGKPLISYSLGDQLISKRLVKIWANFVKYRNPTPKPEAVLQNLTWPKVTPDSFQHVNIGNYEDTDLKITSGKPKANRMAFWDSLYGKFGHRPYDTY
ncbi:esterase E4-like [Euwallacea fornicatus]|uniref:esterase E4-like n=1 Tax=Euwallacea fornicatus TaxID=995702 RepID=UPI00338E3F8A